MAVKIQNEINQFVLAFLKDLKAKEAAEMFGEEETQSKLRKLLLETLPKSALKLKDPNAPKKPMSGYLFFNKEMRAKVKEEMPEEKGPAITKELARRWKELSEKKKAKFEAKAKAAKEEYEEAKAAYNPPSLEELAALPENNKKPRGKGKAKKEKDPNAPKKNKSAYLFFSMDKRAEYKEAGTELSNQELMRQIGDDWKSISPREKKKYETMAAEDKERYKAEMAEYKEAGGSSGSSSSEKEESDSEEKVEKGKKEKKVKSKAKKEDEDSQVEKKGKKEKKVPKSGVKVQVVEEDLEDDLDLED